MDNDGCFTGMTVGIAGLGLIGGSMAQAIKAYTPCKVLGFDGCPEVENKALACGAIDERLCDNYEDCDIILIGLYPHDTVLFLKKIKDFLKAGAVVVDLCGVKGYVCHQSEALFNGSSAFFVGGHPMAGIEKSGFEHSFAEMFSGASMILTPSYSLPGGILEMLSRFFYSLGFGHIEITTAENHDRIIAYTSQLAHVVSSAYMKSPSAEKFMGFSAGSFRDLTRVAKLNPDMWTELFLLNGEQLCDEISHIIDNLCVYRDAIHNRDSESLRQLLQESSDIKERLTAEEQKRLEAQKKNRS